MNTMHAHVKPTCNPFPTTSSLLPLGDEAEPYRYTFYFLALFTLVSFGRIQDLHPILYKFPLGMIFVVLTMIAFMLEVSSRGGIPPINAREEKLVIGIFVVGLITIPTSIWRGHSFETLFKGFMGTAIIFFVISFTVRTIKDVHRMVWLFLINSAVLIFISFKNGISHGDVGSSMYDANDFALVLVITLPFIIYFIRENSGIKKLVLVAGLFLIIAAVISSASRGGFMSLLVIGLYWVLTSQRKGVALVLVGISLVAVMQFAPARAWERISTMWDPQSEYDRSAGDRTDVWKRGVEIYLKNPVLGVGMGNFAVAEGKSKEGGGWKTAHNSLLQIAVELGILGLILFVFITFGTFWKMRSIRLDMVKKQELIILDMVKEQEPNELQWLVTSIEVSLASYMVGAFFLSQAYLTQLYFIIALAVAAQRTLANNKNVTTA